MSSVACGTAETVGLREEDVNYKTLCASNRAALFEQVDDFLISLGASGIPCEGARVIVKGLYQDACEQWSMVDRLAMITDLRRKSVVDLNVSRAS